MNQNRPVAMFFAVAAVVLAVLSWIFGMSLLPTWAVAQEEGTLVPWTITWGMIWMTTIAGLGLAAFLLADLKRGGTGQQ